MRIFKLNLRDLIILIILSAPIGTFLFLNNHNKINYEIKIKRGFAVAENLCDNYLYEKIGLVNDSDLDLVYRKYKSKNLNPAFSSALRVLLINDVNYYQMKFKGIDSDLVAMNEESAKLFDDILEVESSNFDRLYRAVKIHCRSGEFNVLKMIPAEKINIQFTPNKSYKKLHLIFLAFTPLVILYLLYISFRYIKRNKIL